MNQLLSPLNWWELHQRKARGEALSEQEECFYEAELARQDREAPPLRSDLTELKKMREQVQALACDNANLRDRVSELEKEIHTVEHLPVVFPRLPLTPEPRESKNIH